MKPASRPKKFPPPVAKMKFTLSLLVRTFRAAGVCAVASRKISFMIIPFNLAVSGPDRIWRTLARGCPTLIGNCSTFTRRKAS